VNGARRQAWAAIEARYGALPGVRIDAPMFVKAFFSSFWKSARSWFC
jgi:hypothetical protein